MNNIPIRTCLVCREKHEKKDLFRIAEVDGKYQYDSTQTIQARGTYVCKSHECLKRLAKNKKINLSNEDLYKMATTVKKAQKDYLSILNTMKNSEFLSFGINMVREDIKKIHFLIIAEDISEKNDKRITRLAREHNIKYIHYGSKMQLGAIFDKPEVNLIGIKSKKVARGMTE
ncbi:MAG: DUF448 domain-containing protein [Fusobacteria bacterium]|nr:MAG: DUF448 domain-containing protein [Fusobacteriota bacterium]